MQTCIQVSLPQFSLFVNSHSICQIGYISKSCSRRILFRKKASPLRGCRVFCVPKPDSAALRFVQALCQIVLRVSYLCVPFTRFALFALVYAVTKDCLAKSIAFCFAKTDSPCEGAFVLHLQDLLDNAYFIDKANAKRLVRFIIRVYTFNRIKYLV